MDDPRLSNSIAAPTKECILEHRPMNQRRTRPSAPVNDRIEEVERLSDWVSPWSLDPDLPPQRRPRPMGLDDPTKASMPAMPPPSMSVPPRNFEIDPGNTTARYAPKTWTDAEEIPEIPTPVSKSPPTAQPDEAPIKLDQGLDSNPNLDLQETPASSPPPTESPARIEPEPRPETDRTAPSPVEDPVFTLPKQAHPVQPTVQPRPLPSFPTQRSLRHRPSEPSTTPHPTPRLKVVEPDEPTFEDDRSPPTSRHQEPSLLQEQLPEIDRASERREPTGHPGFAWGTLVSLSLGLLAFTFLTWLYLHDIEPEDDADLRIDAPVDVTPVITAPQRLQVFLNSIEPIDSRTLASQSPDLWDTPSLSRFVQANGPALDNLKDLLEDPNWHPRHSSWHDIDLGSHRSWTHAALLKQAEAAYHARLQQEETAFVAAIDLAELARRLEELWSWPSYMQRSLEVHERAARSLADLLRHTRLPEPTLRQFQSQYQDCAPDTQTLVRACNAFYVHEKKLLLGAGSGEPLDTMPGGVLNRRPSRLLFKTYETLSGFADVMRLLKSESADSPFTDRGQAAEIVRRTRKDSLVFYQPNAAGQTYFCERMTPYLKFPAEHTLAKARHALVTALFATRRHLASTKQLPKSLGEMIPQFLSDIPVDPYTGEPLIFNPLRGLIYSVGDNLTDEEGMITEPQMNDPGEPTVQIGVVAATAVR